MLQEIPYDLMTSNVITVSKEPLAKKIASNISHTHFFFFPFMVVVIEISNLNFCEI